MAGPYMFQIDRGIKTKTDPYLPFFLLVLQKGTSVPDRKNDESQLSTTCSQQHLVDC